MAVSSNPQGPLSVGNVISAGLRLYSDHFKDYFGIALLATLWILLPFLASAVLVVFFGIVQDFYPLLALAIPAVIVLFVYCLGRYMAGVGAIARLAFGELTNQPETVENARRFTRSRLWPFVWMSLLLGLLYTGIWIVVYLAIIMVGIALFAVSGAASLFASTPIEEILAANPGLVIGGGLAILLLIVVLLIFFLWLGARLAIPDLPLAIETEATAAGAIGRSWQLTQQNAWRIALIIFVTALIALPLVMLTQVFLSVFQIGIAAILPADSATYSLLVLIASYASSFLSNVFMLPLWQSIKATIYYDLRSRREGLDLELRDRRI